MELKELRKGNIVMLSGDKKQLTIADLHALELIEAKNKQLLELMLKPVEITHDYLILFGFEELSGYDKDYKLEVQKDKGGGHGSFDIWVDVSKENPDLVYPIISIVAPESEWLTTPVKKLHELQNLLFSLVKLELPWI